MRNEERFPELSSEIDSLDRKILDLIQEDARASFAQIAKKVGVSEGTIHLRVKRMVNSGTIKGFYALLAPEKVGRGLTAFVELKADPSKYREALNRIQGLRDVYEIHDVTGEFYAILKVRTVSKEGLARVIDAIGDIEGVTSTQTTVVLRTIKEAHKIEV
jgi:Lrp/AsnC family transcriptional regulator for asnA, asnC and gidA